MKFGEIEVLRESREVLRSGSPVKISSRAFDLLEMLIDADGALVSNEAIMAKVWPTTIVEENNIQVQICALRKLFGRHKGLIKNVFGRGYRLERPGDASAVIAPVNPLVSTASIDLAMYKPPLYLDEFFGREALLGQLTIRVQERRPLLTVVGPAGCGKSRLALEAARRLEQHGAVRTLYLSMASGAAATDAFGHIEQLLIQTAGATDGPSPGQHTLVLVDNCDLVAERVAEFVRAMRAAGRALSVIATSRAPLRLSMEDVVYVEPFRVDCDERDLSTAIDMFVARASDVRASTYTDDGLIPYLREMVQEVDGLPLGIEFVARQTALLGVDSVRALFERDIELPKRVIRHTGDARHESLTSALSWTWNHLPSDQQKILSHFASSGQHASLKDLSTIARTVGLSEEASFEALSGVIDSAFVFRNFEGSRAAYRMPNTVRRFLRALDSSDNTHAAQ
ncbi:winged helix-turn-helix domain-containing protein [Paraburkholderia atlantica]|uniref:winged helix-turn-helix domain-containing protein n=1 Tax=Paraburkholderia atlantica TaxID=2654982 RepID=UPI003D1F7693